jgi:hypothetical protein
MTFLQAWLKQLKGGFPRPDFTKGDAINLYDPKEHRTLKGTVFAACGEGGIMVESVDSKGKPVMYSVDNAQLRRMVMP